MSEHMYRKILIGGILSFVCVVVLGVFLLVSHPSQTSLLPAGHDFTGSLNLTLAEKGGRPHLYRFDFSDGKLSLEKNITPFTDITKRTSQDGGKIAVATAYESGAMTINTLNLATGEFTIVSHNELPYKREPSWSPTGAYVAYTAIDKNEVQNLESWGVFVAGADTEKEWYVSRGVSPIFSLDDSALLYLKNDGLHVSYRDDTQKSSKLVWPMKGMADDMKLALSPDGSRLAWSNRLGKGGLGDLVIFSISWEPLFLKPIWEYELQATHMAFSPDGEHVAAFVSDYPLSPVSGPQIVIGTLETGEITPAVSLSTFSPSYSWLTQWNSK